MNKITVLIILGTLVVLGFAFAYSRPKVENVSQKENTPQQSATTVSEPQTVDKLAYFAIFTNGTFRVFTAPMYHNLSADMYIEANNPNTIIIKKAGATWSDFFSTLPFKLSHECLTTGTNQTFCTKEGSVLKFYLNGERKENVLDQEIQDGDKLLVTYGSESEIEIKKQLDKIP